MGTSRTPARRAVAAVRESPARHDLAVAEIEAASNLQVRRRTSILPRYTCPALTATVTVSRPLCPTGCAGRYCRTARSPARRRHPRRGTRDRAPRLRTRGRPVPAPPVRQLSRSPGSPAQPSAHPPSPAAPPRQTPGPPGGRTGMHARLSGARQAGTRDRRGPSVAVRGKPTVHTDRPGGRTPSAMCPWTPRHNGPTALQGDTRRDREETARIAENSQLAGRFRIWWQVLGSNQRRLSRRFYRPLPLATRATCQAPPCGAAERRIADNTTGCDADPPASLPVSPPPRTPQSGASGVTTGSVPV